MKRFFLLIFLFVIGISSFFAQKKGWDSTYYTKYKDRLIISFFQSYRSYSMDISQKTVKDTLGLSKIGYVAEANLISGIEINYDKFNNMKITYFTRHFKSPVPVPEITVGHPYNLSDR